MSRLNTENAPRRGGWGWRTQWVCLASLLLGALACLALVWQGRREQPLPALAPASAALNPGSPIALSLSVVPNSDDDRNLAVLFEANRVGKGKQGARDVINITAVYPDGRTASFTQGVITDGMPANSPSSAGRFKSKTYQFAFENVNRT